MGVTLDGDGGPDVLVGTDDHDTIYGSGGNDVLRGLGGNDLLDADTGVSFLYGGDGNDSLFAMGGIGIGRSTLYGGNGVDLLGSLGAMYGGAGGDYLSVGAGLPGVPAPLCYGGIDDDVFLLSESAQAGTVISGGGGEADALQPGSIGDVTLDMRRATFSGIEVLDFSSPRFFATERGLMFRADQFGSGIATDLTVKGDPIFSPTNLAERIVVTQISGAFSATNWTFDRWGANREFVDLRGGAARDVITGSAITDRINGGNGDDRLSGGRGTDTVLGGAGADSLLGGDGNDLLNAGLGDDRLDGGLGNDTMVGGADADVFVIRGGRDVVTDFDPAGDGLLVAANLAGGPPLTAADVLDLATVVGTATVIAFSATNVLRLNGITDVASLEGTIGIL